MTTPLRTVFARFTTRFDTRALAQGEARTDRLTQSLKRAGAAMLAAFGVNAIRNSIGNFIDAGDEIGKTAKTIGIGIGALQAWRFAADRSGVETQAFNGSVVRLQRQMLDANRGLESATRSFDRLGVKVTDAEGQLRPVEDVLLDMADPLANLESSSERVGILSELMGRQGARMGPLFAEGADGVRELLGTFEELGGGIGADSVKAAEDMKDAMLDFDTAMLSVKSKIAVVLLPALQRLVEGMQKFFQNTHAVRTVLTTGLVVAAVKATAALSKMGVAGLVANAKMLSGLILTAAAAVALGLVVEDVITTFEGGDSVLSRQIVKTETWLDTTRQLGGAWGKVADILRGIVNMMDEGIGAVMGFLGFDTEVDQEARQNLLNATQGAVDIDTAEGRAQARALGRDPTRAFEIITGAQASQRMGQTMAGQGVLGSVTRAVTEGEAIREVGRLDREGARQQLVNQANTYNINGSGLSEEQLTRAIQRAQDRSLREATDAFGGVAGGEGL